MSYTSGTNYRSIKTYSGGRGIVSRMNSNAIQKQISSNAANNAQGNNGTAESSKSNAALRAELRAYSRIATDSADSIQKSGERLTATGENSIFGVAEKTGNTKTVVSEATDFVNSYNNMMSSMGKLGGGENKKYMSELKSFAEANKDALKSIGITVLQDGSLTMNKKEMEGASLENLKKVFNGKDSFAGKVTELSEDIEANVQKKLKENMTYLNGTNSYDKGNTGNFFNMYI